MIIFEEVFYIFHVSGTIYFVEKNILQQLMELSLSKNKYFHFLYNRSEYSYQRQILAIVLFYKGALSFVSFLSLFILKIYLYTWPLWLFMAVVSFILLNRTLTKGSDIQTIRYLLIFLSCFFMVPIGLYLSGSIRTPVSIYILMVMIDTMALSSGKVRNFYLILIAVFVVSFMIIEQHFNQVLYFSPPDYEQLGKLWTYIYLVISFTIYREMSAITNANEKNESIINNQKDTFYIQSITDPLTGLFNKGHMSTILEDAMIRSKRQGSSISLLAIDIDFFKAYNDLYGHLEGDDCLKEVARIIQRSLSREGDKSFRFGGEEFIVVLDSVDMNGTLTVADRIMTALKEKRILHEGSSINEYLTISIGIFLYEGSKENLTMKDLLSFSDRALYKAKDSGRNRYCIAVGEQFMTREEAWITAG